MNTPLLLLIAGALTSGLLLTWLAWRRHQRWLAEHRAHGLLWSMHLLRLIMHLQQHRGMATAWLNGDLSFAGRRQEKCQQIEALLCSLPRLPGDFERSREDFERDDLQRLHAQWRVLSEGLEQLTAFESMTRHTALIATLLSWLRGLGDGCLQLRSGQTGLAVDSLVQTFVERLPALAEALGQTRALGCGLLASGSATAVGRVQMGYLCQRVDVLLQDSASALLQEHSEAALRQAFARLQMQVQLLLQTVQQHILASPALPLASEAYFRQATAAIDAVFALIELLQNQLQLPEQR